MLEAMKEIALQYIATEILSEGIPENLSQWFINFNQTHPDQLLPYLIEDLGKIEKVYTISPDIHDSELVHLTVSELTEEKRNLFPFVKPSGSQSGQLGPVIKRSYTGNKAGPSPKIIKTTYDDWKGYSTSDDISTAYYEDILNILSRRKINFLNKETLEWHEKSKTLLDFVIFELGKEESTVLITVKDTNGRYPGEIPEYLKHLMNILRPSKYETTSAPGVEGGTCCLCEAKDVMIFPNGLKGAGINFGNVDREGAFSNLSVSNSWKNFALCGGCADLLYIYKNHAIVKNPFQCFVAGEKALIVPAFSKKSNKKFMKSIGKIVKKAEDGVETVEQRMWDLLVQEETILNLNFYWVTVGQNIEDLQGAITDVPPTRLREISQLNRQSKDWESPVFPVVKFEDQFRLQSGGNYPNVCG